MKPIQRFFLTTRSRLFIAVLLVATFASCASVQRDAAPAQADRPAAGKALVTFYRESSFVGMAVGFNVRDNDLKIGGLPNGSYFVYQATPGVHRFTAATEVTDEVTLNVLLGKAYFISGRLGMGFVAGRPNLTIVSNEEGAAAVRELRRVKLQD